LALSTDGWLPVSRVDFARFARGRREKNGQNHAVHVIRVVTDMPASPERCFDLARDAAAHVRSASDTGERIISGRASGLFELGDEVTFEARHFGIRQRLTSRITAFDRPNFFQDRMLRGAFRFLEHDHRFQALPNGRTRMTDELRFIVPLGWLGWPVGQWVIRPHLRRFLETRGRFLCSLAEGEA
jgi:ligand-binding SRPBCC domain-containing protein